MESQTPWGTTVTHQRVQALSCFHVRDVNVMIDMGGSHEIPKTRKEWHYVRYLIMYANHHALPILVPMA